MTSTITDVRREMVDDFCVPRAMADSALCSLVSAGTGPTIVARRAQCKAPVNIAVIKYWGKRDTALHLPINGSISATLAIEDLCATTTVIASPSFARDCFFLNGREEDTSAQRFARCRGAVRAVAEAEGSVVEGGVLVLAYNDFPTAAGLASSAAGYAALVCALAGACGAHSLLADARCLSRVARQGSGSACRSVLPGFVEWERGVDPTGCDSVAVPVCSATHWPDLQILLFVACDQKKEVGSSEGMQLSVQTSALLPFRAETVVPARLQTMREAIVARDFATFADLTIRDSNQMHAVCLDTSPPLVYMSSVSRAIVRFITAYNKWKGETRVAYTFDAGPNACVFVESRDITGFLTAAIALFCPRKAPRGILRDACDSRWVVPSSTPDAFPLAAVTTDEEEEEDEASVRQFLSASGLTAQPVVLEHILHTVLGSGPVVTGVEKQPPLFMAAC